MLDLVKKVPKKETLGPKKFVTRYLPVEGVHHLDGDQNGKSHSHRVGVLKDTAIKAFELGAAGEALHKVGKLEPRHVGAVGSMKRGSNFCPKNYPFFAISTSQKFTPTPA